MGVIIVAVHGPNPAFGEVLVRDRHISIVSGWCQDHGRTKNWINGKRLGATFNSSPR